MSLVEDSYKKCMDREKRKQEHCGLKVGIQMRLVTGDAPKARVELPNGEGWGASGSALFPKSGRQVAKWFRCEGIVALLASWPNPTAGRQRRSGLTGSWMTARMLQCTKLESLASSEERSQQVKLNYKYGTRTAGRGRKGVGGGAYGCWSRT
jgi:hypothetical protein